MGLALACIGLENGILRAEEGALPVNEIVRRAVLRDDQLRANRTAMKCDRTIRADRLDASGKVISTTTKRDVEFPTEALAYSTTVETAKDSGDAKTQKIDAVMSLHRLAPRYDMTLRGEETIRGVPCYAVDYKPKAAQATAATREEKVVSNLHGHFWISKEDFSVVQSDGTLSGPVSLALIASVNQMDIKYYSQALPNGDTAPKEVTVTMAVKAPFYDFRQKQVTTEENWRPR